MSTEPRVCPNCQTAVPVDAPAGVCPACALRAGFADSGVSPESEIPTIAAPLRPATVSHVDQLVDLLPELEDFELIGRGGMGVVYKARHRRLQRPVAVKVLQQSGADDAMFAERFVREARTLAQLDHPNIVRVYDFGNRENLYYLIMELVDGASLRQTIEAGELDSPAALAIVPPICAALQYAHDQGVVHRDIKPENILVDRNGTIKIADFGLAKIAGHEGDLRLTRTQQAMGTPHYMAPEQIKNAGDVDHRADIFALGVVFYELLTGDLPVGRFPVPSQKVEVDVRLDEVVLRTLEREPNLRYQQASVLGADVESFARGDYPAMGVTGESEHSDEPKKSPKKTRGYEYRSQKKMFGLPLVHIAFAGDPEGKELRTASGIIAIGDVALGGVAIGGFSFGAVAFGGISSGLVSVGGVTLGLLTAIGGVVFGTFTVGGISFGITGARGALTMNLLNLTGTTRDQVMLIAWLVASIGVSVGVGGAIYAWLQAVKNKE